MPTINNHHVAVWLDHHEARIFRIGPDAFDESTLRANAHHMRRHPERNASEADRSDDAKHFFDEVAHVLHAADEVLIVGPSTAKLHFIRYLHAHDPKLETRVLGVETVDHPTDPQLAAFARTYFRDADRMRGIAP